MIRKYKNRLEVLRNASVSNEYGGNTLSEVSLGYSWATVTSISTPKLVSFGLDINDIHIQIKTRWRNDLNYFQDGIFFKYKGVTFIPSKIENKDIENEEIIIIAKAVKTIESDFRIKKQVLYHDNGGFSFSSNHSLIETNYPTNIEEGDLLVLQVCASEVLQFNDPQDWQLIDKGSNLPGSNLPFSYGCWYKISDGTESLSQQITSNGVLNSVIASKMHQFKNNKNNLPSIESVSLLGVNGSANHAQPIVTSTSELSLMVDLMFVEDNNSPFVLANNMINVSYDSTTQGTDCALGLFSRNIGLETSNTSDYIFSSGKVVAIVSFVINP